MTPEECRQLARDALGGWRVTADADADHGPLHGIAWAVLAVAGELAELRSLLEQQWRADRHQRRRG